MEDRKFTKKLLDDMTFFFFGKFFFLTPLLRKCIGALIYLFYEPLCFHPKHDTKYMGQSIQEWTN